MKRGQCMWGCTSKCIWQCMCEHLCGRAICCKMAAQRGWETDGDSVRELEKEKKTEGWVHERKRGWRGEEKKSVYEQRRDFWETGWSEAELSDRCVSHRTDKTWHTPSIAHSSLHQSCSVAESSPLSLFLESGIDCVCSMLAISIFSCGERGDKATESVFHFHRVRG